MQGGFGNDVLEGGDGDDKLLGYSAGWLINAPGSDIEAGNDVLYGGRGNDWMFGGRGNDTYLFGRGDGADKIDEEQNASGSSLDILRLGAGVLPQHVTLYRTNDRRVLAMT